MPEASIDALFDHIEAAFKAYPELKEKVLQRLGADIKDEVLDQMEFAGLHDEGGKLRAWQHYHIGSGKGYVAVRPVGGREGAKPGRNSPGAITNYVESGHAIRRPSGTAKRNRKSRAKMAAVPGRHFYAATQKLAEAYGGDAVRTLAEQFVRELEGRK